MTIFGGGDTGVGGAIAFYDSSIKDIIGLYDIPVYKVEVAKDKERSRVNEQELLRITQHPLYRGARFALEWPEIRPLREVDKKTGRTVLRQPGAAGMFAFGVTCGIMRMACIAGEMPLQEVRPGVWKGNLGVRASKDDSRRSATLTFPRWAGSFLRVKDDGRAEAALIALWASKYGVFADGRK